jgi:hypothetical protein
VAEDGGIMHDLSELTAKPFDVIILRWTIMYSEDTSQTFSQLELVLSNDRALVKTLDSPSEVKFEDLRSLQFQNTFEESYCFIDRVLREKVLSWSMTRPSYDAETQVIPIAYALKYFSG